MTTQDSSKQKQQEGEEGFPIQAKLLLAVIVLAVLLIILKVLGVF